MRVALLAVAVACAPGCNQILGIGDFHLGDDQGSGDGANFCLGSTALYQYCAAAAPTGALTLNHDIDTDSAQDCQPDTANGVCVIAADTLDVQRVVVTGMLPLVLVAGTTLDVTDKLDASSTQAAGAPMPRPARVGPGATAALCAGPAGMDSDQGAGAGAGGSFGDKGADGEAGGSSANIPGGKATDAATFTKIQAGCAGGKGGDGDTVGSGGLGGVGGGAIYLVAGTSIHVTSEGSIFASGQGGAGANMDHGGGGGGGAGGLIGLDAPQVAVDGSVVANGGAGGEGANGSIDGADGDDGTTSVTMAAMGHMTPANGGGDGGNGSAINKAPTSGTNVSANDGGGGGGGSVGVIWTHVTIVGTQLSPAPSLH